MISTCGYAQLKVLIMPGICSALPRRQVAARIRLDTFSWLTRLNADWFHKVKGCLGRACTEMLLAALRAHAEDLLSIAACSIRHHRSIREHRLPCFPLKRRTHPVLPARAWHHICSARTQMLPAQLQVPGNNFWRPGSRRMNTWRPQQQPRGRRFLHPEVSCLLLQAQGTWRRGSRGTTCRMPRPCLRGSARNLYLNPKRNGAGAKTLAAGQQSDHLLDATAIAEWLALRRRRGREGRQAASAYARSK